MADELYDVRNALVLGNYHQAVADGSTAKTAARKAEEQQAFHHEKDALVAQAQIGLGQFDIVLTDLKAATAPILIATRNFASLKKDLAGGLSGDASLAALVDAVGNEKPSASAAPVAVLAATGSLTKGDPTTALTITMSWVQALEGQSTVPPRVMLSLRAVTVDALLALNRVDLADKELTAMRNIDDDSVQTIIAGIVTAIRAGPTNPDRYGEAEVLVNEAVGRCGHTATTLNLLALSKLGQGKPKEAEQHLVDAMSKRSGDPVTLANLAVIAAQTGSSIEAPTRYTNQARGNGPHTEWVKAFSELDQRFNDACVAAKS